MASVSSSVKWGSKCPCLTVTQIEHSLNTLHGQHPVRPVPPWFVSEPQKCLRGGVASAISAGDEPQRFSRKMRVGVDVSTGLRACCGE